MSIIAKNVNRLPIPAKLERGQEFITRGTDNPLVPGNEACIAALAAAQAAFAAASAAYENARLDCAQLLTARDNAEAVWREAVNALAAFTQSATKGEATALLSAGFGVKQPRSQSKRPGQVKNVRVDYTGSPGYSGVTWRRVPGADAYVVECCQDPIGEDGWKNVATVVGVEYAGNGAIPGRRCWYRVAAVNRSGQGPWSEPALRPVM